MDRLAELVWTQGNLQQIDSWLKQWKQSPALINPAWFPEDNPTFAVLQLVASLANGSIGYVPDRKAYPQGAYEPVSARCAAGSGEMLVDAATRLLVETHGHSR